MPMLDEINNKTINDAITNSLRYSNTLTLTYLRHDKLVTITGTVLMVMDKLRMAKIILSTRSSKNEECVWISLDQVSEVEIKEVDTWYEDDFIGW